jgi:DNA-binding IclR family transcriptional regulator
MRFHPFTERTHLSAAALLADVEKITADGHAIDNEEHEAGICCVAAPIHAEGHDLRAGVSVTGPAYRVTPEQLMAWAPQVRATAADIVRDIKNRLGPRR